MLKHSSITFRRIGQFIEHEIAPRLHGETAPLKIETLEQPNLSFGEAKKGDWKEVARGYEYGPAYTTFWFRVTGKIPRHFEGKSVGAVLDLGGERTVWSGNSPIHGIDFAHEVLPLAQSAQGGEKVQLLVESVTRNPQHRVHLKELPREALVEKVERAELVVVDEELLQLYFDLKFGYDLLQASESDPPLYGHLMRALNDVCNTYSSAKPESVSRCRRILRDAWSDGGANVSHTVTAVGHAHLDTAWLWPIHVTKKKMAHTTATQLALMERYPEYVFVHSQASQYEWLEKGYPELFQRVKKAIEKGQWEPVGSMWVEADCNVPGGEALVRQFLYGRRYFREKFGYETEDMWLPDVFGYSAAIPQILEKFGIRYFLTQKISWNQFNKFPHNTFWWQGIDGTKIWSHFPPADTYTGDATPKQILTGVRNYRDHGRCDESIYVYGWGDGGGGPTQEQIEMLRRARGAAPMPEIGSKRKALDFFRAAYNDSNDLPVWNGELYFELHRGTYTSQARTKMNNRVSEFLMRDAELLACFAQDFPRSYPADQLEGAWKLVLLNQFHDILPGSSVHEVYEDAEVEYAKVRETVEPIIARSLRSIGARLNTEGMRQPIALFQNATVGCTCAIPWESDSAPASLSVGDEVLPTQIVNDYQGKRLIFPTPHAALGAVAVGDFTDAAPTAKYRLKATNRRIESNEIGVRFDAQGNITSVELLEDGTEFIQPGKLANMFQIFEDKPLFWSAWDIDAFAYETGKNLSRCESFEVVERGPVRAAVQVVKRFGNSTIRQTISVGPTPGVRFDTEIDWHEEDKLLKVAFPVNVNSPRATYEIQYGNVERPTHYNTSWDIARFETCAQKWVDLSEGDQGVALLNNGKYGHDIHGNTIRLTLLRSPKAPDPMCDMGLHRFTYVLLPHFGPYNYAGVVQAAYALNSPVRYQFLDRGPGMSGSLPPFVSCDDRNIVVEAVKKAEDSDSLIVRLYECHNARGRAELYCARAPKTAWLCGLDENPLEELEIVDDLVTFAYKPFEIITIRLDI